MCSQSEVCNDGNYFKWFHYLSKTFRNVNHFWKPAKQKQELNKLSFASNQ